jgi:hypothetical protein
MTVRNIANTAADATLPKTPVNVAGQEYNLCFDLGALAEAETAINAEIGRAGRRDFVNLLVALPVQNLASTRIVFAAAVRTFHPELTFDQALALVGINDVLTIAIAIRDAWEKAQPAPDKTENPRKAGGK